MSTIVVIRGPEAEPLDLATEVKPHCRVTISDEDGLLAIYLQAARETAETETGRSFINKGYRQSHDRFPHRHDDLDHGVGYWFSAPRYARKHGDERQQIKLLRCPLVKVEKLEYTDTAGVTQTMLPSPERWQSETHYVEGDQVEDSNGNLQEVTAGEGESEDSEPSPWAAAVGLTTTDGPLTWTCRSVPAPDGDFLVDRDSEPPRIFPLWGNVWPQTLRVPNAVRIYFDAGYGTDGSDVPARGKVLMLQMIGNWNENRESVTPDTLKTIPNHLEALVWSLRVIDYAPTK